MNGIIDYIEHNFEDGNERVQKNNLDKLIGYLNTNKIVLEDSEQVKELLDNSKKLNNMLKILVYRQDNGYIYENDKTALIAFTYISQISDSNIGSVYQEYIKSFKEYKILTREEEYELAKRVKKGDQVAREEFIKANLRLVVKVAYQYYHTDETIMDLIEDGNEGLIKAAMAFDYKKGYKFSTYAVKAIRRHIERANKSESSPIRIPEYLHPLKKKVKDFIDEYKIVYGVEPSIEIISKELDISVANVKKLLNIKKTISLDALIEEEVSNEIIDENTEINTIDEIIWNKDFKNYIFTNDFLNEIEREILILRFGLIDGKIRTLADLAKMYGVKHQRIDEIEKTALTKLRFSPYIQEFYGEKIDKIYKGNVNDYTNEELLKIYRKNKY